MELNDTTDTETPGRQWLGSLVRRGEKPAGAATEPVFTAESETQWLGSVARREAEIEVAASAWTGSAGRAAIFKTPPPPPTSADVLPPANANVHELPGHDRIVMGALGMTLRVAA